jgi:transcriptional regulator with XRE-family HTH domain
MPSPFGFLLRNLREQGGWSRREVAEAAGVSEGAVRDYELGKRAPSYEAVVRLSKAIGAKAGYFAHAVDTTGVFRLQQRPKRVPYSRIMFGKYKGRRMDELPGDYLRWIIDEKPGLLRPGQLDEAKRVLEERRLSRTVLTWEEARAAELEEEARQEKEAKLDPLVRAKREEAADRGDAVFDPEFFGNLKPPGS